MFMSTAQFVSFFCGNVFCKCTACFQGEDDVYMCIRDQDSVSISAAYVEGRTHPEMALEVLSHLHMYSTVTVHG